MLKTKKVFCDKIFTSIQIKNWTELLSQPDIIIKNTMDIISHQHLSL